MSERIRIAADIRYAQGLFGTSAFPAGDPSQVGSASGNETPSVPTTGAGEHAGSLVHPSTAHNSASPSGTPLLDDDEENPLSSVAAQDSKERPQASSAGAINQDPDIPNIEEVDFAYDNEPDSSEKGDKASSMFRARKAGDAAQDTSGLTAENMRQLNLQASARGTAAVRPSPKDESSRPKVKTKKSSPEITGSASDRSRGYHGSQTPDTDRAMRKAGRDWARENRKRKSAIQQSTINANPPPPPRQPRSRGSLISYNRRSGKEGNDTGLSGTGPGSILLESGTGSTTNSADALDFEYDMSAEQDRVRSFFETKGYLPAPRQAPDDARRRLRIIRRLGLENPEKPQPGLQRFIRLACTMLQAKSAMVSIVGRDKSYMISSLNFPIKELPLDSAVCSHTMVASGPNCFVVHDPANDWRFKHNPFVLSVPYAIEGEGVTEEEARKRAAEGGENKKELKFFAGAPLRVGTGNKETVFGSLCILDDKPHAFGEEQMAALAELAGCVVSEVSFTTTLWRWRCRGSDQGVLLPC